MELVIWQDQCWGNIEEMIIVTSVVLNVIEEIKGDIVDTERMKKLGAPRFVSGHKAVEMPKYRILSGSERK